MQFFVEGARIRLECLTTKLNLRIKEDNHVDGNGRDTESATFKVRCCGPAKVKLQARGNSRKYIGILPSGKIVSCDGGREAELSVFPSSTGGDMIFLGNDNPARFYLGVNTNGMPFMCNHMTVGQFGAFIVRPVPHTKKNHPPAPMPVPGHMHHPMPAPAPVPAPGPGIHHPGVVPGVPVPGHAVINTPTGHIVIKPDHPGHRIGHDYSRAKIIAARYGDFASHRLSDVTHVLSRALNKMGHLEIGPNYNSKFGDPCPGVKKALLLVWSINDKFNDNDIHWGILSENEKPVANLDDPHFDHVVSQFPAGVYGDFASGKYVDVRPVFAREFRFMSLPCHSYNGLFGDPAPGIRKALVVFYATPVSKLMSISGEDELKVFSAADGHNKVIAGAFCR